MEVDKKIERALLPLRRPMIKHSFKGHDSLRGEIDGLLLVVGLPV
jgi:hypothetical protein